MKLLVALTIALVFTGANAGFLTEFQNTLHNIGDTFKNVYTGVKPLLSSAVNTLVGDLKTTGTQILAQGAQALLGSLGGKSTRDATLLQKVDQFLQKGNGVVATLSETVGNLFNGAISKLTSLAEKFGQMQILGQPISKYISQVEDVVSSHNLLQNSILKQLVEQPAKLLTSAAQHLIGDLTHHKRSAVSDLLSGIGQQLASTFKPVIDKATQHITNIGTTLKNAGTALFGAIKPSIDALTGKLTDHVNALKQVGTELLGHGKNALSALTAAVTDIMGQTFHNAQPTIQKALETAKNAGSTVVNHVVDTLTGNQ